MSNYRNYLLITGASSGIGRQLAIGLSEEYNLILSGRNRENLLETQSLCSIKHEYLIFDFDLSKSEEIEDKISNFISKNNIEISHFIHCAGCMKLLPLKMIDLNSILLTYRTNVFSAILLTKILTLKKVNKAALKNVVYISSNISNFGAKAFSLYGSSKGALDSFMRSLAVELAPRVRINSILPGAIRTQMTNSIFENDEKIKRIVSAYPLGIGNTSDILEAARFLLSDKSRWITGQQFTVDGGRTINITG